MANSNAGADFVFSGSWMADRAYPCPSPQLAASISPFGRRARRNRRDQLFNYLRLERWFLISIFCLVFAALVPSSSMVLGSRGVAGERLRLLALLVSLRERMVVKPVGFRRPPFVASVHSLVSQRRLPFFLC